MTIGWFTSLRRFFGYGDTPAARRAKRRASGRNAQAEDGFAGIGIMPDFDDEPQKTYVDVDRGAADKSSCGAIDTNSRGSAEAGNCPAVDSNISFEMNSGFSSDAGAGCSGSSSSE